tara:strand:- start:98 stop:832 length:735 start_codon:yes stop_codon:yes gene_type:complete
MAVFTYTAPTVGGSADTWGATLNTNWSNLSTFLGSLDSAELAVLDGLTASTAELNLLDGVTATTAEINILAGVTADASEINLLDGVTATTDEINYVSGVTSAIQTQLDAKAADTTQAEADWEAGTSTTESVVSPAKVKAAIDENNFVTQTAGSAPFYAARAWGTVRAGVLEGGQNFASYDQATAVVTFTTAMPNATFSVVLQGQSKGGAYAYNRTTTGFEVELWSSGGNAVSKNDYDFDFAVFA